MGRKVAVAETEPRHRLAVGPELFLDRERLVGAPPTLSLCDAAAERVHHRVEVRADAQPVQGDVVTGVADHRHVSVGSRMQQAAEKPRATDATGQGRDAHRRTHGPILTRRCSRRPCAHLGCLDGAPDSECDAPCPASRA
jgi:hypothetical protein